jgi:hypothetical protein
MRNHTRPCRGLSPYDLYRGPRDPVFGVAVQRSCATSPGARQIRGHHDRDRRAWYQLVATRRARVASSRRSLLCHGLGEPNSASSPPWTNGSGYAMPPMTPEDRQLPAPPPHPRRPQRHLLLRRRHRADPPDQPRLPPRGQQPRPRSARRRVRRGQRHRRRVRHPHRRRRSHRRMTT